MEEARGKSYYYGRSKKKTASQSKTVKAHSYESASYKRYFEGYKTETFVKNGKTRIRRVYVGNYYVSADTAAGRRLKKLSVTGLFLLAAVSFGGSAMCGRGETLDVVLAVLEMLNVIGLLLVGIVLPFYLISGPRLTIGEYKTTMVSYQKRMKYLAVCWLIMLAVWVLNCLVSGVCSLAAVGWQLAYGGCIAALYVMGQHFAYGLQENEAESDGQDEAEETDAADEETEDA